MAKRRAYPSGAYRQYQDEQAELRQAGRDLLLGGLLIGITGGLGTLIRRALARTGGANAAFAAIAVGGVLLLLLGLAQWRTGKPRVFARGFDRWMWWTLATTATAAVIAAAWPWIMETFFYA